MTEDRRGIIAGFKEFIVRGNVVDLAVGIIIGAAFKMVVDSLVEKFINPLVGGLVGKPNFDSFLQFTIGSGDNQALVQPGAVLTALVNFLIMALVIYLLIVTPMNSYRRHQEETDKPEEVPADIALLTEIRDSLQNRETTQN